MRQDDIERALAEHFDAEHLSVYADYLQSIGDPRGELIALDLQRLPISPRYDRLMADWLGEALPALRDRRVAFRYGFVSQLSLHEQRYPETLGILLAGPAAPYVLRVHIEGGPEFVQRSIAMLARQPQPWLQRLVIRADVELPPPRRPDHGLLVDDELCRALADATPSLDALEVHGYAVLGNFGHPHLRAMRVGSPTSVASLLEPPAPGDTAGVLAALQYLDLNADPKIDREVFDLARLPGVLSPARLPRLSRLDLALTGTPVFRPNRTNLLRLLETTELRRQLTHATLSSALEDYNRQLEHLVAAMPQLVQLTIRQFHRGPVGRALPPKVVVNEHRELPSDEASHRRSSFDPEVTLDLSAILGRT